MDTCQSTLRTPCQFLSGQGFEQRCSSTEAIPSLANEWQGDYCCTMDAFITCAGLTARPTDLSCAVGLRIHPPAQQAHVRSVGKRKNQRSSMLLVVMPLLLVAMPFVTSFLLRVARPGATTMCAVFCVPNPLPNMSLRDRRFHPTYGRYGDRMAWKRRVTWFGGVDWKKACAAFEHLFVKTPVKIQQEYLTFGPRQHICQHHGDQVVDGHLITIYLPSNHQKSVVLVKVAWLNLSP